jgi:hypothetical protein
VCNETFIHSYNAYYNPKSTVDRWFYGKRAAVVLGAQPRLADLHVYPVKQRSAVAPQSIIDLAPKPLVVLPIGQSLHLALLAAAEYCPTAQILQLFFSSSGMEP